MANWIFYAMLMEVCHQIAVPRNQTIERISGEMVWRTFYHFSPALKRGQARELVSYLVEHHQWLGLVKAVRNVTTLS